jgi:hypothetical protein
MKEKRILCAEVSVECENFVNINSPLDADIFECKQGLYCMKNPGAWKPITKDACKNCKHAEYKGITREKFIMVVAKAICKTDGESCITCGFNCNEKGCKQCLKFGNYITLAEAVLEDILEANNGK